MTRSRPNLEGILFDLDGTLVDTAPDMVAALNRLRQAHGHPPTDPQPLRNVVSQGAIGLLKAGMPACADDQQFEHWRQEFLSLYAENLCCDSRLFNGMAPVLEAAENRGLPWGVVTNKPGALARPLVVALGLEERMACLIAGDDLDRRKPHPEPLLHACAAMGSSPERTAYIGDAEGDMQSAVAAGCLAVVAAWGYIEAQLDVSTWGGDLLVHRPLDLIAVLFEQSMPVSLDDG
jgi:phosphoglycolate phosphatase